MDDYLSFFNLTEDPYRLTPDPHFFYPSAEHKDALFSLDYAMEKKEGFSLIVGEPGTGKSTVLRTFIEKWKDKAEIALIMTPRLSPEEFLQAVLEDLNVPIDRHNKNEMIKAFRDILIEHSLSDKRVIIIVDEAQNLPLDTLEELRLLSNLETEKEKLLQIMLVGQPELKKKLLSESLTQLDQRIAVKTTLQPLSAAETQDYINFRLRKAGKGSVIFEDNAVKTIYKLSKGIPRLINLLSSRSLMAAYIEGSNFITRKHVDYARQHLSIGGAGGKSKAGLLRYSLIGSTAVIVMLIALGVMRQGGILTTGTNQAARQDSRVKGTPNAPVSQEVAGMKAPTPSDRRGVSARKVSSISTKQQEPAEALTRKVVTVAIGANLRDGPALSANRVSVAAEGTRLEVTGEVAATSDGRWHKVKMEDGSNAWVSERVLETLPALQER
jgi:type II secretory pathway predicted ATPase ExeA